MAGEYTHFTRFGGYINLNSIDGQGNQLSSWETKKLEERGYLSSNVHICRLVYRLDSCAIVSIHGDARRAVVDIDANNTLGSTYLMGQGKSELDLVGYCVGVGPPLKGQSNPRRTSASSSSGYT